MIESDDQFDIAIIDADSILYQIAYMQPSPALCRKALDDKLKEIMTNTGSINGAIFIKGKDNFRYEVDAAYKGNRKDNIEPEVKDRIEDLYEYCKDFGIQSDGGEADDYCGIAAELALQDNKRYIICHIDKDLDCIPGWHYNFRKDTLYYVEPEDGYRFLMMQILTGDATDNIQGLRGVGPKTAETLERLGLRTVADIANLPRATLIRALGQASGSSLYELAWGRDYRDVTPNEPDKSISAAETFAQDIDDPEEILQEFLRLTEKAAARLRENGYYAKTISIKVRFADFSTISRSKTLPLPIDSTHDIYEIAKSLYLALNLDRARLRLVGISLDNLSEAAPEQLLLGSREKGWREADTAIDRAKLRFGGGSVRPGRLIKKSSADPKAPKGEKSSE